MLGKGGPLLVCRDVDGARSFALELQGKVSAAALRRGDHDLGGCKNLRFGPVRRRDGAGAREVGVVDQKPHDAGAVDRTVPNQTADARDG